MSSCVSYRGQGYFEIYIELDGSLSYRSAIQPTSLFSLALRNVKSAARKKFPWKKFVLKPLQKELYERRTKELGYHGDRFFGKLGKVPVIGMVIRENYVEPDMVLCHLDLPVKVENEYRWLVRVPE